ncbi:putative YkwD family protein [Metabacillus niabensis]|uniref:YkwD family protein n=1 Tax=Metabacillus niabensis TaxID=324854 RepID=A0ABT9YYB6_9BACI|nr:CAP domain-containing protein [Metabacillus niabensis]MDQ0224994.1 putative YkwD family protein [Metabacillus niabensis]
MIMKKASLFITGALVAGLVACNNNEAMDNGNNTPIGTLNVADDNNRTIWDNRNEFYSRNVDTRNNGVPNELETAHRDKENNRADDNDFDLVRDNRKNNDDGFEISSSKTDLSSKEFPHTRAIVVQEAKYKYEKLNANQNNQHQYRQWFAQQPGQQQPGQQQPGQQQPGQQQPGQQQPGQQQPGQQQPRQQQQEQQQPNNATDQQQKAAPQTQGLSQAVQQVIDLTNAERRRNGLADLKADTKLSGVAQKKSEDMQQNNYFSHTSPTYGSPFDMMRDFGVTYKTAGENIAQGQQTPQQVVQAWMNSEGHRKNILSRDFTHIGVGYDSNGHHWTQMFIGK